MCHKNVPFLFLLGWTNLHSGPATTRNNAWLNKKFFFYNLDLKTFCLIKHLLNDDPVLIPPFQKLWLYSAIQIWLLLLLLLLFHVVSSELVYRQWINHLPGPQSTPRSLLVVFNNVWSIFLALLVLFLSYVVAVTEFLSVCFLDHDFIITQWHQRWLQIICCCAILIKQILLND